MDNTSSLRDLSLLGTMPDRELGKLWGISGERVRQLRNSNKIEGFYSSTRKLDRLREYLCNHEGQTIYLNNLKKELKFWKIGSVHITCDVVKKLADENNIKINLHIVDYEHHCYKYIQGCRCGICRLSHAIKIYLHLNFGKSNSKFASYFANTYFENYRLQSRDEFYKFVCFEYEKVLSKDPAPLKE